MMMRSALTLFIAVIAFSAAAKEDCSAQLQPLIRYYTSSGVELLDRLYFLNQTELTTEGPDIRASDYAWSRTAESQPRVQAAWKEILQADLTKPAELRCLVHASFIQKPEDFYGSLKHITEDPFVSTSYIFPGHVKTFFTIPVGFIVRAKPKNLVATDTNDMRSFFRDLTRAQAERNALSLGVETPASLTLLAKELSKPTWNEIILENFKPGDIEPVAVFVLTEKDGSIDRFIKDQFEMIQNLAKAANLPVIKIPKN